MAWSWPAPAASPWSRPRLPCNSAAQRPVWSSACANGVLPLPTNAAPTVGNWRSAPVSRPCRARVLSRWPADEPRLALALDATTLKKRFTVLTMSVLYRGCAIPVAWKVVGAEEKGAWRPHWLGLLTQVQGSVPAHWTVLVLTDRGL